MNRSGRASSSRSTRLRRRRRPKQPRVSNCRRRHKLRSRAQQGDRGMRRVAPTFKSHSGRHQGDHDGSVARLFVADGDKRLRRNSSQAHRPQSRIRGAARCPEDFNLGTLCLDDVTDTDTRDTKHPLLRGVCPFVSCPSDTDRHFVPFCVLLCRWPSLRERTRPMDRPGAPFFFLATSSVRFPRGPPNANAHLAQAVAGCVAFQVSYEVSGKNGCKR